VNTLGKDTLYIAEWITEKMCVEGKLLHTAHLIFMQWFTAYFGVRVA
jgi:hypothetical protein